MESSGAATRTRALISAFTSQHAILDRFHQQKSSSREPRPPRPCSSRLEATWKDRPYDVNGFAKETPRERTVFYLAYGSNLSSEKFRGNRGIKPLSQLNVQVPGLRMTFDLPGIPYAEPCFANSARRDPKDDHPPHDSGEKTPLLSGRGDGKKYRKDRWHKGLIGVVYEVTVEDYAQIIATEGGGASYQDILVDCYPLPTDSPYESVPQTPTSAPFKAHTLFAPAIPDGEEPPDEGGNYRRPDPSYAQASARYLKLITDGAAECKLPYEYQDYLLSMHPFTITNSRQRVGQFVFLATWAPIIFALFALGRLVVGQDGGVPGWMKQLLRVVFQAVWRSYDGFFKPIFGEGERTLGDDVDEEAEAQHGMNEEIRKRSRSGGEMDLESATVVGTRPI